ncbi:dihydrolipoyl dehydrogenase [Spirochaeta cellobiosiphila]|uniref:dihydrolipoyl dehydrogenase n=1 Tax=Spirochaeta cellobiosiphila TaxID=504483 RepID=UPI00041A6037|nr:dihydrolipoyl dehydrogenase [Spirochaeta cellobiosiphila]
MSFDFDLIVIGAGPGGYVAAIRASQLGLKTAVIEKDSPGGVCLNIGCIPSKALIHQAENYHAIKELEEIGVKADTSGLNYKAVFDKSRAVVSQMTKGVSGLFKKNKVEYIKGTAKVTGENNIDVDGKAYSAKFILLATGSSPRQIPGFEFDEEVVLSSTGILMLEKLPSSLVILGSGAIGMEFAYVMNAFGVDVTVIEMLPNILPVEDRDTAKVVEKAFKNRGVKFLTGTTAKSLKKTKSSVTVTVEKDGKEDTIKADKILVAVGRVPNTANLGLEELGIRIERGFVKVGDYYQTGVPSIYAIGDIVPSPLLAHVASKEGEIAVEHMAGVGHEKKLDPQLIPGATYCEPQIASFGYNEARAKEAGIAYEKALFPFVAIGKAVAIGQQDGLVKILFDPKTKEILGCHVVGPQATELIHELLLAKKAELLPEDIATLVHAHPTLSEGVMEAARAAEGWAIHI